jgi:parvulin-like peptidyl-prolyl isomerase
MKHHAAQHKHALHQKARPVAESGRKSSSGGGMWVWAVLLIIGLAIIAVVIILTLRSSDNGVASRGTTVAALVNGQPVYQEEVDEIYDRLPPEYQVQVDKTVILEQLIEQELLIQAAEKEGISVSRQELDDTIAQVMVDFQLDEAQLDAILQKQNITRAEFERVAKRQLLATKLINETVYKGIVITDEQVAARYEQDKVYFAVPEMAVVRHILIAQGVNGTLEDALAEAKRVKRLIADDFSNFCDLVANYTTDLASVATCGEYQVAKDGQYVPEFQDAAFDMDINDTDVVETEFGYHVMWKVSHQAAGTAPLEEVAEQVRAQLFNEEANKATRLYLDTLKDEASIEKYNALVQSNESAVTSAPLTVEADEQQEEDLQVTVEPTKPARQSSFGSCLAEAGAVLYGTSWSPDVQAQKDLLGEALGEIVYVDCDPAEGSAPAACEGIMVYPTWVIGEGADATVLSGKQSLNALERVTGCSQTL